MSKTKKKQASETALILLIILFILAGLEGCCWFPTEIKLQREQLNQAAIAALRVFRGNGNADGYSDTDTD